MAFLVFPLLVVLPVSFTDKRYLSMPDDWSLQHYETLFTSTAWLSSIGTSLLVAAVASVIATMLAVSFALGVWYLRSRWAVALLIIVMLPMAVPPVISAMVLYFLGTSVSDVLPWLANDTLGGLILAHIIMVEPFAVVVILVALSQLDRRIETAARSLGASLTQTTFLVVLPNIRHGILSTLFLTFVLSWEEIAVTLFVTSVNVITLPRRIWSGLRDALDPVIAAISAVLILLTVLVVLGRALAPLLRRRGAEA
jgi:putative spermidine/putrescine transport system permease protein